MVRSNEVTKMATSLFWTNLVIGMGYNLFIKGWHSRYARKVVKYQWYHIESPSFELLPNWRVPMNEVEFIIKSGSD